MKCVCDTERRAQEKISDTAVTKTPFRKLPHSVAALEDLYIHFRGEQRDI